MRTNGESLNIVLFIGVLVCTVTTWKYRADPLIGAFEYIMVICGWVILGFELGRCFQREFPMSEDDA